MTANLYEEAASILEGTTYSGSPAECRKITADVLRRVFGPYLRAGVVLAGYTDSRRFHSLMSDGEKESLRLLLDTKDRI